MARAGTPHWTQETPAQGALTWRARPSVSERRSFLGAVDDAEQVMSDFGREPVRLPDPAVRHLMIEVAELRRRLEATEAAVNVQLQVEEGTAEAWRTAHAEVLAQHRGRRVAIHPQLGIVASDADLRVVLAEVRRRGLQEDVVIELVR